MLFFVYSIYILGLVLSEPYTRYLPVFIFVTTYGIYIVHLPDRNWCHRY